MYIDKLDDIGNEYNNKYHRTIKMKPADTYIYINNTYNTYINFAKEINDKNPEFKIGDHLRVSKYKNIIGQKKFL